MALEEEEEEVAPPVLLLFALWALEMGQLDGGRHRTGAGH